MVISRALCIAVVLALVLPASADAHAVLERTVPQRGAELDRAPDSVGFYFNEPVEASFGAVRVFDHDGDQVQSGDIFRPRERGDAVAVRLDSELPRGTYTATYRVISADSHPVSGGFVFAIGEHGTGASQTVSELLDRGDAGPVTSTAFWLDRWLGYAAIGIVVGALIFLVAVWNRALAQVRGDESSWDGAAAAFSARMHWTVVAGIACGVTATLIALPLQGATAGGMSVWAALDPDTIGDVLDTRFGTMMALRLAAWALLAVILTTMAAAPRRAVAAVPLAFLVLSPALTGHASSQSPTGVLLPTDVLHVGGMGVWLGGLVTLAIALPAATRALERPDRTRLLAATLARFSPFALAAVIALAASGTVQAIVEVGTFEALLDTGFGRAVVAKVALLVLLIGFGAANRQRIIPALLRLAGARQAAGGPGRSIRRNLRAEVALVAVVLGVAALLVGYAPASDSETGPVSGRTMVGPAALEYTVDPAQPGRNEVHLYMFDAETGEQYGDAREVGVDLALPGEDIGPIEADVRKGGPGHHVVPAAPFGVSGDWEMAVTLRVSRFEEDRVEVEVPIG